MVEVLSSLTKVLADSLQGIDPVTAPSPVRSNPFPMRHRFALLLMVACSAPVAAETLSGPAEAIDGDTLAIGDRRVRLFGIDAPEIEQTCDRDGETWACGGEAAGQLASLLATADVTCVGEETDDYGRLVAVCRAGGYDLNKTLVTYGWAVAFRRYSEAYVGDELRAKAEQRGIWRSSFELPESYRLARQPQQENRPAARPRAARTSFQGGCVIKGNRSRRGDWIYHLPGMPYYNVTRAEDMFCSEADAQAAGYRRAIVR